MQVMQKRRVVITGIGVVSPVGSGVETFWKNIVAGVSGVDRSPILVDSGCHWKIAGEVRGFEPKEWLGRKDANRMDRFAQLALVASYLGLQDSGLDLDKEDPHRTGVVMGTTYAGLMYGAQEYDVYKDKGLDAVSSYLGIAIFTGAGGGQVSLHLGLKAPSITISTGCDCSTAAVAEASDMIQRGDVDVMFSGGADAPIHPFVVTALGATGGLSNRNDEPQKASRPFDRKRDGFVMGEGGCVLIVEELEHALRRGAKIYAEVLGWASTCDAYHMCHPEPDGEQAARALQLALAKAGVRPDQVDYLNAHGTSTPLGDKAETVVIKKVFGEHAYRLPISSIKSQLGHMQGACGSAELAACCLSIRDNVIPPTINYEYPDPDCDLDYVPNESRHRRVDIALSNSFSFGGRNTVVVLGRHRNGALPPSNSSNGNSYTHENGSAAD
jgi:3-oxoacyl-[acyl-carrier-protein] synthase II